MSKEVALPSDYGPAMRSLNPRRQAFVIALCHQTGRPNASRAYRDAGYKSDNDVAVRASAYHVMHDARVQEAIMEYSRATLSTEGLLTAVSALKDVAADPAEPASRVKAAEAILGRVGFHAKTEHVVTVGRLDRGDDVLIERMRRLAGKLGKSMEDILGPRFAGGPVIEMMTEDHGNKDWMMSKPRATSSAASVFDYKAIGERYRKIVGRPWVEGDTLLAPVEPAKPTKITKCPRFCGQLVHGIPRTCDGSCGMGKCPCGFVAGPCDGSCCGC